MRTRLICVSLVFVLTMLGNRALAQAPNISYAPATEVYTLNTAITGPILSNAIGAGAVAAFGYGNGTQLAGVFNNPYGLGTDPSGNVYVINYGSNTISRYSSAGTLISNNFFTGGALSNPAGIAFDASGNAYILNYNHTNNGQGNNHGNAYVEKYNSSGVFQSTIVTGLGTATGIAIDLNNNIYIAEGSSNGGNQTVAQYNTSGQLAFTLSSTNITNPTGVGVDGAGNIYVLDDTKNDVVKFNSAGTFISTVITGLGSNVLGIYVDGAGNIYIGNSGTGGAPGNTSGSVKVYNSSGTLLVSKTGLNDPEGVVTDNKGNLYVSDFTNNTVTRYPPVGGYSLSGLLPAGLSFDSNTGAFSGAPTVAFAATTYTVTAYNANGSSTSNVITLSCPAILGAPIITYSPNTVNVFTLGTDINTQLTTPLSPVNSGGAPISYTINTTLPAGLSFNTSTGAITGTPTATSLATTYTVTATNGSGSGTTTVSIACVVDDFWVGGHGTDWNTKQNWSANKVPGPTDLASIGVVHYTNSDPVISTTDGAVSVDFVTFGAANAATLTVQTGASLIINNILTINTNATPIFNGTGTGVINVAPAAVVKVNGTGVLTINSPLTFTLQSNTTGSASVDQISSGGAINGTVSVERYFQGGATISGGRYVERNYRIISPPVHNSTMVNGRNVYGLNYIVGATVGQTTGATSATNAFITGCTGGNTAAGNPSIYLYREDLTPSNAGFTAGNYIGITNITNSTTTGAIGASDGTTRNIPVGNGVFFFFRGNATQWAQKTTAPYIAPESTTLTATGTLNQGPVTVNDWFTSSGLSYTSASPVKGFNMVGNPYPCSIDLNTYNTGGIITTNVSNTIYEFNPVTGNFDTYLTTGPSSGLSTGKADHIIASGQGFFVLANGASPTLQFTESAKSVLSQVTGPNLLLSKTVQPVAVQQLLGLKMVADSSNYDDILISFNSTASSKYNNSEDAMYVSGSSALEGLSSLSSDNVKLTINSLPLPAQSAQVIKLNVTAVKSGQYTFERTALKAIPQLYDIWLIDNYKKDSLDMRNNPTYSFNIDLSNAATFGSNRFSLVIRQNPALGIHLLNFTATKTTGGAQAVWKTDNEQNYTNFTVERSTDGGATFNVLGGFASSAQGAYSFLDSNPATTANEYRLKIEDLNGAITYSNIVTLMYANPNNHGISSNISIYPNPTTGKVNLAINQTTGTPSFSIIIVNNLGVTVKSATSPQPSWQSDVSQLVPGTYFIQVINKNTNTLVGKSSFVKL